MRKVGVLCDQIIEAGWLLALVIVPLFFNVYSSRVFEPDKISLLRSIATIMAVAWVAQRIEAITRPTSGGERAPGQPNALERFLRAPLVVPTLLLVMVYILASITSVAPRASLWGSYQRLQGDYTTFSYIIVFLLMTQTLRRREQLDRLLTTIVLTSVPIALYGLLQHYEMDPLPWGGDVSFRVAANMGNAIFIGAYLILVVPITLVQVLREAGKAWAEFPQRLRLPLGLFFGVVWAAQSVAWAVLRFERGLITSILMLVMLALAAAWQRKPLARFLLAGAYSVALTLQLVCIFFSQSRGPWLGLAAGLLLFGLLYVFMRRWRVVAVAFVGAAVALAALLVVLNIPGSPLASVRDVPYVGRLGRLTEIDEGTGKVRVLIWEGASKMLTSNPARAAIGYGPEAMYVAYNPFYPPDLAHYEARNASPDRSHNEAFDALVTTGVVGYLVYMFFFTSIFYYGIKWLGLIRSPSQFRLFVAMAVMGALLGFVVPLTVDHSLRFIGIGLPVGFLVGIALYIGVAVLRNLWGKEHADEEALQPGAAAPIRLLAGETGGQEAQAQPARHTPTVDVLLIALVAAIVAHFAEIHLGIAVVATRTYFWIYAALLLVVGQGLIAEPQAAPAAAEPATALPTRERARRPASQRPSARRNDPRAAARPTVGASPAATAESPWTQLIILAIISGFIMATVAWDYTTNPQGLTNPIGVIMSSLTTMAAKSLPDKISLGMLWLVLSTFGMVVLVSVTGALTRRQEEGRPSDISWTLRALLAFGGIAGGIGAVYAFIHAVRLNPRVNVPGLISEYYTLVFILWAVLAFYLYRRAHKSVGGWDATALGSLVVLGIVALLFISSANVRIIRADISYKQGLKYDGASQWDNAIYFYQQAIDTAPQEDFYYLFLGRALMEKAKLAQEAGARDALYNRALQALQTAKQLNPLNTDHTANIGRLYRTWAEAETDSARKGERYNLALAAYQEAIKLSPNNAQLYNEMGLVFYLMGQYDLALAKYDESLALDSEFLQTYLLISDVRFARKEWAEIIAMNEKIVAKEPTYVQGWSAIGYAYSQLGQWDKGIAANLKVLEIQPEDYGTLKNVALLYEQQGDLAQALSYAERALKVAPDEEKSMVEQFITQVKSELNP